MQQVKQFIIDTYPTEPGHTHEHAFHVFEMYKLLSDNVTFTDEERQAGEIAALLHDAYDHKFGNVLEKRQHTQDFLETIMEEYPHLNIDAIMELIDNVSLSVDEKKNENDIVYNNVLPYIQDADRLYAVGAMGIARCFSFGGYRQRSFDESMKYLKERVMNITFKTELGKILGEYRKDTLARYIQTFEHENELFRNK